MASAPLVRDFGAGAAFAYRDGRRIDVEQFLWDVSRLAASLPDRRFLLNLCTDRYHFSVGFAAALVRRQINLLPPNETPDMIERLASQYPGVYCLSDRPTGLESIETKLFPDLADRGTETPLVPEVPVEQVAVIVFTSGSTGEPVPYRKTWGSLVGVARAEIEILGLRSREGMALVGTVPPQHVFGLETTVMAVMQGGLALNARRPFYPADIRADLASLPRPRGLVTSPVHLRVLLAESDDLPPADFLLCATAPLSPQLAAEAEARFGAHLYEIYGCTESGGIASRRTVETGEWRAMTRVALRTDGERTWVKGGHVETEVALADVIELRGRGKFLLHGRTADLVNIAGKRTSLANLNYHLNSIKGVHDGAFVVPEQERETVTRLTAYVVAPGLTGEELMNALRQRIDAAFLPRPLHFVGALPRNETGKLPRQALNEFEIELARKTGQRPPMLTLPLVRRFGPRSVFAYREGRVVRIEEFLRDVWQLAAELPERRHVFNLCADRYRFAVGFSAALLRRQISLLPPNETPDLIERLVAQYPDVYCLSDRSEAHPVLDTVFFPAPAADGPAEPLVPDVPEAHPAVILFTSGSTGDPVPFRKTWGSLVRSAIAEVDRLEIRALPGMAVLGTVPPQHSYGLESTLLMAMQGGLPLHAGRPFFPADVRAELAALPRPRCLVTTPVHLRVLLTESDELPPVELVLCATAPLSPQLAAQAEARFAAPLYEIYGCTEAGQVATRRTVETGEWRALPGLALREDSSGTWVKGGHVETEVLLADIIELRGRERFLLHGRTSDLVNMAGKRTSLAHLNYHLNSIKGVLDGAFVAPEDNGDTVARLAAFVVAPEHTSESLMNELRQRIDAAFLPRPLCFVNALPRNAVGKLPLQSLNQIAAGFDSRMEQGRS